MLLAESADMGEVKAIMDMGAAAKAWARAQKLGTEAIRYASSIQAEAEIRLGEMLRESERARGSDHGGRRSELDGSRLLPSNPAPTLSDLGLSKRQSSEAQTLAAAPPELQEKVKSGDVSRSKAIQDVRRGQKEDAREERRRENAEKVAATDAPIIDSDAHFATIVIDPPWDWGDEGDVDQLGRARPQYSTMPIDDIAALPVGDLADVDAHIYLWVTNRSLPKAFGLLEAWGFRYITCLTWCKPSFGMGNYFRGSTEQVLFGVKGSQPLKRRDAGTWFEAPRGPDGHSSKPTEFYGLVESCSPGPYLEMFARTAHKGWSRWGADSDE
jgi:N6-adenosine-specific RNA methylase IME4